MRNAIVGVCAVIRNEKGEFLLIKHKKHTPWYGYWILPGGKLKKGESLEECVKRELKEELGVDCVVESLIDVFVSRVSSKTNIPVVLVFYKVRPKSHNFTLKRDEISKAKWFDKESVKKGKVHEDTLRVLQKFYFK